MRYHGMGVATGIPRTESDRSPLPFIDHAQTLSAHRIAKSRITTSENIHGCLPTALSWHYIISRRVNIILVHNAHQASNKR